MPAADQHQTLDFVAVDQEFALYSTDPTGELLQRERTKLLLPLQAYANLGQPERLTVTIAVPSPT